MWVETAGRSKGYKDTDQDPLQGPVSRFIYEVRALRRGGWDHQN